MRKLLFLSLLLPALGLADQSLHGYCAQTATLVLQSGGLTSSPQALGIYPGCTVAVYFTGTTTPAPIYSDNGITPLANPFTANTTTGAFLFYAANGRYDINLYGGSPVALPTPFTLSDYLLYDLPGVLTATGCLYASVPGVVTTVPCLPAGPNGAVQYNSFGSPGGDMNLNWNAVGQTLLINGISGMTSLTIQGGGATSAGGYISTLNSINSFSGASDGANLQALRIGQNSIVNAGGYIHLTPITYNPYNEPSTCKDSFGNPVQQPLNLNADGMTNVDVYLWVSTSPLLPASPTAGCPTPGGPPLPVSPLVTVDGVANQQWGLTTNAYMLARGGFATDNPNYNSIQTFFGGMYSGTGFTTPQNLALGPNATCAALNAIGGGYGGFGYVGARTYCAWDNSIGQFYAWTPGTGGGGGSGCVPGGATSQILINNGSGTCTSYPALTFNSSTDVVTLGGSGYVAAPGGFNALACALSNCVQAPSGGAAFGLGVSAQALYPISSPSPMFTPGAGYGGMTWAGTGVTSGTSYEFWNGTSWFTANLAASGSGCTVTGTTGNVVYLSSSSTCGNSTNLTFISQDLGIIGTSLAAAALSVHTGYGEFQGGVLVDGVNTYNAIQAIGTGGGCTTSTPCAGVLAAVVYGQSFVHIGSYSGAVSGGPTLPAGFPAFAAGDSAYNTTSACLASYSGSAWSCPASGSGSPGAPSTSIQTNNGGAFGGASNFVAPISGGAVTQVTLASASFVTQGTSAGFDASQCTLTNCVQVPVGGMLAQQLALNVPTPSAGVYPLITMYSNATPRGRIYGPVSTTAAATILSVNDNYTITGNQHNADLLNSGVPVLALTSTTSSTSAAFTFYTALPASNPVTLIEAVQIINNGNTGIGTTALTGAGQNLVVEGASAVSGITLVNGFITSPGLNAPSNSPNAIQVTGSGGFSADNPGGGAVAGCAYAVGNGCAVTTSTSFIGPGGVQTTGLISTSSTIAATSTITTGSEFISTATGSVHIFQNAQSTGPSMYINANGLIEGTTIGSSGQIIAGTSFGVGINNGVSCSGTPTSSFASVGGIVTHC